ncbi:MAG: methyltransferase domain-containing protein [Acidobacteria bacterium]|nr:methyltransferase domain-containing protein [Acidobacteriota bacterium]
MQETPPHLGGHMDVTHIDEQVLDALIERFRIRSMIDIGCGPGGMVKLALKKGLRAVGVDGDPRIRELSGLGEASLIIHDFAKGPLQIDEQFDLAWSVEFLEHVDEIYQSNYMNAFRKAKYAFCTAAPPGKPGYHHVNCRDFEYWREVFRIHHLLYDNKTTQILRNASSMSREFVRETGMLFTLDEDGPMERYTAQIPGQAELLEEAARLIQPGDRVLDLGAGRCEASRRFAQADCRVTAVGMHFHRYLDAAGLEELRSMGVKLKDTCFEDFDSHEAFDAVWCAHMLEHQRNPGQFIDRCLSFLRPGGWLFLSVPPFKTQVVSGHLSVWFPGLLIYNLVVAGLDCSTIHIKKLGYNIAAFVRNIQAPLPNLTSSLGDIEMLADRFPSGLAYQGFEGDFTEINWPPR